MILLSGKGFLMTGLEAEGKSNWLKIDQLIAKIESARNTRLEIAACMYTYEDTFRNKISF